MAWLAWVQIRYRPHIYAIEHAPEARVAVVFGAGVRPGGRLSAILQDRMDVAIKLYQQGKVQKLLVSGDNRTDHYDEPSAMRAYALQQGVASEDIQPDFGGRRTYDTCYRARHIFQLDSAILVSQSYHLPRALFICEALGVQATAVPADRRRYTRMLQYQIREGAATLVALWDVTRHRPPPVMGEALPL